MSERHVGNLARAAHGDSGMARPAPIRLPFGLQAALERTLADYLRPPGAAAVDFTRPAGEPGLAAPDSVSWQVFRNPLSLYVGGVAAVMLELAEPRVAAGVWNHTSFRTDPLSRLRRTGLAAMVTVYAAQSVAERMIAGIVRAHEAVRGTTTGGAAYHANDPELLTWVQATAVFGFLEAYAALVVDLAPADRDLFYAEAAPAARLYGVPDPPRSQVELRTCFAAMRPKLRPSPILAEFLQVMGKGPILPRAARPLQPMLLRAAVHLLPDWARSQLQLGREWEPRIGETRLIRGTARAMHRVALESSPAACACIRLGLPADYLQHR